MREASSEKAQMSEFQQAHLRTLAREECLELLQQVVVGRIGYVTDGIAIILPVNFTVLDGDIVFCTAKGSTLKWLSLRGRLSFRADESKWGDREGWSVLIHGVAREVTDPSELEMLRQGTLRSWLRSPAEHWVRIRIETISGRALHAAPSGAKELMRA
jgi:nitroimidazol reductase NimA-like FMN-containing flavoprotein (pyridoxamine 5'-phosphate oxidase superfamily)